MYRVEGKANQGQVCSMAVHRTDNPIEAEGHYLKWHETRELWDFPSITDNISNRYLLSTALVAEDVEVNNTNPCSQDTHNKKGDSPSINI